MEDKRIIKSKKRLLDAFVDLLSKKPLNEISVMELCKKAGVNRTTFYKHFKNTYELLEEAEGRFFEMLDLFLSTDQRTQKERLPDFLRFVESNSDLFSIFLESPIEGDFSRRIWNRITVQKRIEEVIGNNQNGVPNPYVYQFLLGGTIAMIREWNRKSQPKESPEVMADCIERLFSFFQVDKNA